MTLLRLSALMLPFCAAACEPVATEPTLWEQQDREYQKVAEEAVAGVDTSELSILE